MDAMTTTEVTLRVYDLRCDEETKRRASKTRHPRGGAMTMTMTMIISREVVGGTMTDDD